MSTRSWMGSISVWSNEKEQPYRLLQVSASANNFDNSIVLRSAEKVKEIKGWKAFAVLVMSIKK